MSKTNFWKRVDEIIYSGIDEKVFPGAVLLVGDLNGVIYEKAYGTLDEETPVELSTMYDLASITKVIATTTAVMKLLEEGRLTLSDSVGLFLDVPEEKAKVTIFELLTHTSGIQPYSDLWRILRGEQLKNEVIRIQPTCRGKMQYSCLNFITLMAIVEQITSQSFDTYVLSLLDLPNTLFRPREVERCAPTSVRDGKRLRGEPDDELAYYMGGVSGNAGLFSTARDIHTYVLRLLKGEYVTKNVLKLFTETLVQDPSDPNTKRHLGWMAPVKGGSSGDFGNERMFGHTGFTGTSLWITPEGLHVILLTNKCFYDRWDQRIQRIRMLVHNVIFANLL